MKKKILIAIMFLLLPVFIIINSVANETPEENESPNIEVNNDIMVNSPLFTKTESNVDYVQPEINMISDGFEFVVKKGNLSLYTNKKNASIRIQNDVTKFVWASDVLNITDYRLAPAKRRQYQSAFVVDYRQGNVSSSVESNEADLELIKNENGLTYLVSIEIETEEDQEPDYIKFELSVELNENGIDVKIPYEKIQEIGKARLFTIALFPYFGSVFGSSIPGYIFVPSGNGGLVRFESTPAISSTYTINYNGNDANWTKISENSEESGMSLPIFGIAQGVNKNAVIASITSGSSFAEFNYSPSSENQIERISDEKIDGFHKVYNTFNFRDFATLDYGGQLISMYSEKVYAQNVEMNYTFLQGENEANYIGMAQQYQEQLKADGTLHRNSSSGSGNVHLDILGGETEKGIVLDKFIKMTTTKQLLEINDELTKKVDNKFIYTLRGFNKNGYSRQTASNINFDSRLGSLNDLDGLNYYMYYNPVESYGSKPSPDNNSLINVHSQKYYLTVEEGVKYKFYSNVDGVTQGVTKALGKYKNTLAIDGLYRLYGDHNAKYERYQVEEKYVALFNDTMPMYKPKANMLAFTSHYLNAPLYHNRARFITDSVPFLQILLRGYVDYYSTYINFSTNQEIDLLKCIEYGSNLAYLISAEESYLISNTLSNHLYATHYESNKNLILAQINDANVVLNQIKSQEIVDRYVIKNGFVEVTYENGIKVYVNYNDTPQTYNGVTVPDMDYKVV